jgi:Fur family ferric uptake transcriptional regulator
MSCLGTLKGKGLKLTPQRRLIIDIIDHAHSHLTGENIIDQVHGKMPGVHKSTIYRTLGVLEQAGCVLKSESDNHFIYHHAEDGHHHHLVCRVCGKIVECSEDLFNDVEQSLAEKYSFQASFKHIVINGLCDTCKNKA